jgi:hypothetical protein
VARSSFCIAGCLLLLALAGCGGGNTTQNPPPPTVGQIYVTKVNFRDILRFRARDNGDVAPQQTITPPSVRIITGPNTNLDSTFPGVPPLIEGIAVDPTR